MQKFVEAVLKKQLDGYSVILVYYGCTLHKLLNKINGWNRKVSSNENCETNKSYGTSRYKDDIWYLNVVEAPKEFVQKEIFGKWIVEVENEDLTELWHILKGKIECKTENFGVAGMECLPKRN